MNVRGIYKTSLIDFPGRISTVLFLGGCNLRCMFCYNPGIAEDSNELETFSDDEVFNILSSRKGIIEGVTISGGEPTLAPGIETFLEKIRGMSLDIKIDTNGLRPDVIRNLAKKKLLDYSAVDIKTSPEKYKSLTGSEINFAKIVETIEILKSENIDFEVRTTCIPEYVTLDDFRIIREHIVHVKRYYLQQFISSVDLLDTKMENNQPYQVKELFQLREFVKTFADECEIRGI